MANMRSVGVRLRLYVDQYKKEAAEAAKANDRLTDSSKRSRAGLEDMAGGMAMVGAAMLAATAAVVYAGARFDKAMSEVGAVTNATAEELKALREAALDAGAATSFSASEAANAQAELAKAGVSTADILAGGLTGALSLAAAGSLDLATASTIAANAMNTFGLVGSDVGHIADVLAAAANKSAASVEDLGIGLQQVGLVANMVGFSLEETVGLLAAFADRGLRGSDGATSLKTALLRLAAPLGDAQALMDRLGISLYDANGSMVDAATVAGQLRQGLSGLSAAERNAAMNTLFGADAIRAATILYEEGEAGIRDYIAAVNDQGAAARNAQAKLDNLAGDVEALTGSLEVLFVRSGEGAMGPLRFLTQQATALTNQMSQLPGWLQGATLGMGGLLAVTLLATAAFLKLRAGLVSLNAQLIATGASGAIAAKGLRAVTAAAGPVALALGVLAIAWEDVEQRFGNNGGRIIRNGAAAFDALAASLGVAGDNLGDTVDQIDAALARMAVGGQASAAMLMIEDAARRAGIPVEELMRSFPQLTSAVGDNSQTSLEAARANIVMGGAFGEAANEVDGLRRAFDQANASALGWRAAARDAEEAVDDLQKALDESNGSMDITTAAGREAQAAVDELAIAAADAAQARYDETQSVEEANRVYQNYIGQLEQILRAAGMAEDAIETLIGDIASMPTYAGLTIGVSRSPNASFGGGFTMRHGGVLMDHAATGVVRSQARIATTPMVSWAEPSTGGEAYVPKRGNYSRSMQILSAAAGWYNSDVVPRGAMGGGGVQAIDVRVSVKPGMDGSISRAIQDMLRFEVVQVGGGDVQNRLGRRGRV